MMPNNMSVTVAKEAKMLIQNLLAVVLHRFEVRYRIRFLKTNFPIPFPSVGTIQAVAVKINAINNVTKGDVARADKD